VNKPPSGFIYFCFNAAVPQEERVMDDYNNEENASYCIRKAKVCESLGDQVGEFNWYKKAAEKGDMDACFIVAGIYYTGKIVPQNISEAGKWYKRAADMGDTEAKKFVDIIYGKNPSPTAPSSTSNIPKQPPTCEGQWTPATPTPPRPAPAPVNNVWQLKAPAYGSVHKNYKYYGEYVKKGQDVLEFCENSGRGNYVNLKSEVDGYITNDLTSHLNVNAGTVLIEITPGKKKGLFG
jgi:hypothetical protein